MESQEGESLLQKLKGIEALRYVRDNVKRFLRPRGEELANRLAELQTLQACKDAALVGDDELRLLSVCRLAEFGQEAREALEIALYDITSVVCTAAIGMLHAIGGEVSRSEVPEEKLADEKIKSILEYVNQTQTVSEVKKTQDVAYGAARRPDLFTNKLPVRTINYVDVQSRCEEEDESICLLVTLKNEGEHHVKDTMVSLLTYPSEGLTLESDRAAQVGDLAPSEEARIKFDFKKTAIYVEGEMVIAVVMKNHLGQDVSAKSGNCLVRSLYPQMKPLDLSSSEFRVARMEMKPWSREHVLRFNPRSLFRLLKQIFKEKNLHLVREDGSERNGMMRALLIGAAQSIFDQTRLVIQLTLVGNLDESKTKVRIEVHSDEEQLLHIAASRIYEAVHQQVESAS
ncbi:MAG: hypothetical protein KGY80_08285 [Candidatus Thorarchaeota archaeon]|nr:hypothetical protein [Candidatus Thorarchaeota archaeon]